MPNGHSNGSGFSLSRQQAERLFTWGMRLALGALVALLLWNANGIIGKQEEQDLRIDQLKDRVLKLEVRNDEMTRRMTEKDEQIEGLRTLFISGQVRVVPPER